MFCFYLMLFCQQSSNKYQLHSLFPRSTELDDNTPTFTQLLSKTQDHFNIGLFKYNVQWIQHVHASGISMKYYPSIWINQ